MTISDRNQRVAIYRDTGATINAVGQHVLSDELIGTYWAAVERTGGSVDLNGQQLQSTPAYVVRVLADATTRAITPLNYHLVWRDRVLNVFAVSQVNYQNLEMELNCEERETGA